MVPCLEHTIPWRHTTQTSHVFLGVHFSVSFRDLFFLLTICTNNSGIYCKYYLYMLAVLGLTRQIDASAVDHFKI